MPRGSLGVSLLHRPGLVRPRWRSATQPAIDLSDKPSGCVAPPNRVPYNLEERVLGSSQTTQDAQRFGRFGAAAIRQELLHLRVKYIPSVRRFGRILHERRGALDASTRATHPPPPGWYLRILPVPRWNWTLDIVERAGDPWDKERTCPE